MTHAERVQRITDLIGQGKTNKEIADDLHVTRGRIDTIVRTKRLREQALNDVEALDQLRDYPPEMRDLYRIYRQKDDMSPEQALREVVTYCAEVGKAMIARGMPDEEWKDWQ